jgi:flap endonuclease-1
MSLIQDEAAAAVKEQDMKAYTGRKVAIDASMAMYQFMVAVRSAEHSGNGANTMLMNEAGEVTSHIQGLFNRTIRMMTNGLKPCYVFDGKPPTLKSGELAKRTKNRTKAAEELKSAQDRDDTDAMNKYSSRLVKVTRENNEDAKTLLRLMGVPVIEAPCEAEAQCAVLAKAGVVYATGTEDMDALTFATPYLLKKLTFSAGQQQPIQQVNHAKLLEGLGLTNDEFIDLCILCGCDYCDKIPGIGPKTALKLLKKHHCIEEIVKNIDLNKHPLPAGFEHPAAARARKRREEKKAKSQPKFNHPVEETVKPEDEAVTSGGGDDDESPKVQPQTAPEQEEDGLENSDDEIPKVQPQTAPEQEEDGLEDSDDESPKIKPQTAPEQEEDGLENSQNAEPMEVIQENGAAAEEEDGVEAAKGNTGEADTSQDDEWVPIWVEVRRLFTHPEATPASELGEQLKWTNPNEPELLKFLVERMQFNEERVLSGIKRLKAAKTSSSQQRMDSFFKVDGISSSTNKRKPEPVKVKGKGLKKGKFANKGKK